MKFSIIIPTYNRAHLIGRAIQSVINQTYQNWELIIIDDGSTDHTKEIVDTFNDNRIDYHWQQNQERSIARNNGIKRATGEWICFLDSDDYIYKDYFEQFQNYIFNNDCKLIRAIMHNTNADGKELRRTLPYNNQFTQQYFIATTPFSLTQYCFHKTILEQHQFIPTKNWEDKELMLRILEDYQFLDVQFLASSIVEHKHRSVKNYYTEYHLIQQNLTLIQNALNNATQITKKEAKHIYNRYVYDLQKSNCISGSDNVLSYLIKIKQLNFNYLLHGFYYSFKHQMGKL